MNSVRLFFRVLKWFVICCFRHRCQRGGKYKSKSKGQRNRGASLKSNCKCYVSTLENPSTKEVIIAKASLKHTPPCNPSPMQSMIGRVKSGRNFKSIPFKVEPPPPPPKWETYFFALILFFWKVIQRAAALIECRVSTQTLRMTLDKDPDFPRTISTDREFMRNLRLYIKQKGISAPKPSTTGQISTNTEDIDYEQIM